MSNKEETVLERSARLFEESLNNMSDEEFLKIYLECETFQGPTIDEFLSWMPTNQGNKNEDSDIQ